MKFKLPHLGVAFLFFTVSSCSFKSLVYKDYNNFKIQKIGFASSVLTLEVNYYNPNNFGLKLSQLDLDVYINNNYLGHSTQTYQIIIPRKGEFKVPVKLEIDMKNLLKNAVNGLINEEVTLKTSGTIRVGKGKIYKSFPFVYSTKEKLRLF